MREMHRVLRVGGVLVLVSNGSPVFREDYFEDYGTWRMTFEQIGATLQNTSTLHSGVPLHLL